MRHKATTATIHWHEGDVVRKLRTTAGWTLEQLARASDVNLQVIHRLESGRTKDPKGSTLKRIAAAFGLSDRQLRDAVPDVRSPLTFTVPPILKPGDHQHASPRRRATASSRLHGEATHP